MMRQFLTGLQQSSSLRSDTGAEIADTKLQELLDRVTLSGERFN